MKALRTYIIESGEKDKEKEYVKKTDIKFTIWESPQKKVQWLKDNNTYQKIEYKYEDDKEGINIQFLLGFDSDSWHLYVGTVGAVSYDDDPYVDFETSDFAKAIMMSLEKINEFVGKVKEDSLNYIQYYTLKPTSSAADDESGDEGGGGHGGADNLL